MTIDEAIEIGKHGSPDINKCRQAAQLGVEALEYIRDYCEDSPLLPSETQSEEPEEETE